MGIVMPSARPLMVSGLIVAGIVLGAAAHAAVPLALKSTAVELPASDRAFPPGPNVDVVSANCVACHSPGMILNQPTLKRAAWEAEVHKMISVYKAPVAEADVPAIVDYLAKTKGAD